VACARRYARDGVALDGIDPADEVAHDGADVVDPVGHAPQRVLGGLAGPAAVQKDVRSARRPRLAIDELFRSEHLSELLGEIGGGLVGGTL
jgi:hypothetical protein